MDNNTVQMDAGMIRNVIYTLKQIDVRGYDSMDKLVGLVMLFQNTLAQATAQPMQIVREGDE